MSDIKTCPFCGEKLHEEGFGWFHADGDCFMSTMGSFGVDELSAWNTRAPDPRIAELEAEVEGLKHRLETHKRRLPNG